MAAAAAPAANWERSLLETTVSAGLATACGYGFYRILGTAVTVSQVAFIGIAVAIGSIVNRVAQPRTLAGRIILGALTVKAALVAAPLLGYPPVTTSVISASLAVFLGGPVCVLAGAAVVAGAIGLALTVESSWQRLRG